jgi:hypothetical protein
MIEPLAFSTWFISILSGSPDIFLGIALIAIVSLSAYFRMNGVTMVLMMVIFLLMTYNFINSPLVILIFILGGLGIGYWMSKTFSQ